MRAFTVQMRRPMCSRLVARRLLASSAVRATIRQRWFELPTV